MIILGLDPGLANTGWGVIEVRNGRMRHLAHGSISTPAGDPDGVRLLKIHDELERVIQQWKPEAAGIENLYFARNVKSALPVAQARGVLLFLLTRHSILPGELTPVQIKQAVTGNGRADKREVQTLVKILLGMNEIPKPDHAADALAAAIAYDMNREVLHGGRLHV